MTQHNLIVNSMSVTIAIAARVISRLLARCTIAILLHVIVLASVGLMAVSGPDILIRRLASLAPIRLQRNISYIVHAGELHVVLLLLCRPRRRWGVAQSTFHLLVGALADLFPPNHNVDEDVSDARGGRQHGEGKEGLVDVADLDAGVVAPVGDAAGVEERAGHVVAEKAHADQPEDEERDVDEDVDPW